MKADYYVSAVCVVISLHSCIKKKKSDLKPGEMTSESAFCACKMSISINYKTRNMDSKKKTKHEVIYEKSETHIFGNWVKMGVFF